MNSFDRHIKDSLDSFEADFNATDWNAFEKKMDQVQSGPSGSSMKGWLTAASVVAAVALVGYFGFYNDQPEAIVENATQLTLISEKEHINTTTETQEATNSQPQVQEQNGSTIVEEKVNQTVSNEIAGNSTSDNEEAAQQIPNTHKEVSDVTEKEPSNLKNTPVDVLPMLTADFSTPDKGLCQNTDIQFQSTMINPGIRYQWSFGDGGSSDEAQPAHRYAEPGKYQVKLKVISTKDKKVDEQRKYIVIHPAPALRMDSKASDENYLEVRFNAEGIDVQTWYWEFGDRHKSNEQSPVHVYAANGAYQVKLAGITHKGCRAMINKNIEVKKVIDLLAPNALSPNGDGINDTWMPAALVHGDYEFALTITDRAGNVVYKTSDKYQPWNGADARPGDIYVWTVVVKDQNGDVINDKGVIMITK